MNTKDSSPSQEFPSLEEAQRLFSFNDYSRSFSLVRDYWLKNPDDQKAIDLFARLLKKANLNELSLHINRLKGNSNGMSEDPQLLVEAAISLIDQRQHDLAVMLLKRCHQLLPDDPFINYELGFALMSLGLHQEAITFFTTAISVQDDFDTRLNLAVSYICTRQPSRAKEMIERMARLAEENEQKEELLHRKLVLKRLEELNGKTSLNARDWLYILYGTILINKSQDEGLPGHFRTVGSDYSSIAETLLMLRGILEGLGENFEIVEFYSRLSEPLAVALANLMAIPCEPYQGADRVERALLVMAWASDLIGPHEAFKQNELKRVIFAYGLSSFEWLPVTPEITACLSDTSIVPWSRYWEINEPSNGSLPGGTPVQTDLKKSHVIANAILERAWTLESDPKIIQETQEALSYFRQKRELLVIGNPERFSQRCQYSAEAPL